jgi:molecular chaperone DnaK (HSP70)
LAASYLAALYLPSPKPRIAGIDLGTTFSCIAVYHAGSGHVEVVPDSATRQLTLPSVVAVDPASGQVRRAL